MSSRETVSRETNVEPPVGPEVESVPQNGTETNVPAQEESIENRKHLLRAFIITLHFVANCLIAVTVVVTIFFTVSYGIPIQPNELHIILCVIGYQLLIAHAILSQSPYTGWTASLTLKDRRLMHVVLQIAGSALAIAGTSIKFQDQQGHFGSVHGILGIVALIFTILSLLNGVASFFVDKWHRSLPESTTATHVFFGIVTFSVSSIALCFGFDKDLFREWANDPIVTTLITFTGIYTLIVIINPVVTCFRKSIKVINSPQLASVTVVFGAP